VLVALALLSAGRPEARDEQLKGWFDLAVPGGEATLAALDLTLEERAFTLPIVARMFYDREYRPGLADAAAAQTVSRIDAAARASNETITIPAPLDADAWRDILPPVKPPSSTDLFLRLVRDRHALLTATGLVATHDSVRAYLARDRDVLRFIYQQGAGAFAIVARRILIDDGRVVVPGGPRADAIWQSLVGVSPARVGPFLRALVTKDDGRLAWFYDSMGGLDDARFNAAWSSPPSLERVNLLYSAFRDPDPQWRIPEQPFRRTAIDAWMVVTQNAVSNDTVASVLPQQTWALLFSNERVTHVQAMRTLRGPRGGVPMAWLARETLSPLVRERRNRYEMFRLAQRVFANAPVAALPDVAVALGGIRDSRALLLSLERMQVTDAAAWAAAVSAARHVMGADEQRWSVAAFQATLALLERLRHSRTLDVATTTQLLRSLSDAVRVDKRVPRSLASWMVERLMPALPPLVQPDAFTGKTAYESTVLQALAGSTDRRTPAVEWEGLPYIVDPVTAEHERLMGMRGLVPSPGLDAAIGSGRARDLADALQAIIYATALGSPDGPASLSPDVALRHEFGLNGTTLIRDELPWAPPEERQGYGPWRVQGALLGLDLALSRLFLRRVADQQMPPAPTLTLNDLGTLTRTAVTMSGHELPDAERDEIAAAIARGRQRVVGAASVPDLLALARECRMADTSRELLTWMASRQREATRDVFSLRDFLWLGRPALSAEALDRWGVAADALDGRRALVMPGPASWEDYAGRSEAGQITTQVPDLTLRLIEETARLRLPAELVPSLLAFALEDYWHDVRARFADDWPRLVRQAAAVPSSRINDYVAALAGGGPLRAP
jgi:hypothetical protein